MIEYELIKNVAGTVIMHMLEGAGRSGQP